MSPLRDLTYSSPPKEYYTCIRIKDYGELAINDYIIVEDKKVSAHFFNAKNNVKIYEEEIGTSDETEEKVKKLVAKHFEELNGTLGTLSAAKNPKNNPAIKAIVESAFDGSFAAARQQFVYKSFDCENDNDELVLTVEFGVDHDLFEVGEWRKTVTVTYIKYSGERIIKRMGPLTEDSPSLSELFNEFQSIFIEFAQGFRKELERTKRTSKQCVDDNSYLNAWFAFYQQKMDKKEINEFREALRTNLKNYISIIRPSIDAGHINGTVFQKILDGLDRGDTIIDVDISLIEIFVKILLRSPYCKEPLPYLPIILQGVRKVRELRASIINKIWKTPGIETYELYSRGILVARKVYYAFQVYRPDLYQMCLAPITLIDVAQGLACEINEAWISSMVKEGWIPASRRKEMQKYLGDLVSVAILMKSNVYGNQQQIAKYQRAEHLNMDLTTKNLFSNIVAYLQHQGMRVNQALAPDLEGVHFDNHKPERVFKYLQGLVSLEEVELTRQNANEILTIVKLYDQALILLNWASLDKHAYLRSSYKMRARILELLPKYESFKVFIKTVHQSKMSDVRHWAKPKNWLSERAARQGHVVATQFILACSLSKRLSGIVGVRGNTGSGKSRCMPVHSLSVDDTKYGLKKGYLVLNEQVRAEGSLLFDKLLQAIIKMRNINYGFDSRTIEPSYMESSIIKPAKKRGVGATLTDYEVPLVTSLRRVLTRHPYGKDPCPAIGAIVDGYIRLRQERVHIIKRIQEEDTVQSYALYYKDGSDLKLVAQKKEGKYQILNERLFEESLRVPNQGEIDKVVNTVITTEAIADAVLKQDIFSEQQSRLTMWIGKTYAQAINQHANGDAEV